MFASLGLELRRVSSRRMIEKEHIEPTRLRRSLEFQVNCLQLLLKAEACNVFVYDPDTGKVRVEAGTDLGKRDVEVQAKGTPVGRVIASGEPMIVHDFRFHDEGFDGARATGPVNRNAAYAPIRSGYRNEVIGAIEVLNKRGDDDFTDADVENLALAADTIRDLIDSAFLDRKRYGRIEEIVYTDAPAVLAMVALAFFVAVMNLLLWDAQCAPDSAGDALSQMLGRI